MITLEGGRREMTILAVFFDAAGTLIRTARPVGESYSHCAKKYGKEASPEALAGRFRSCFASAPPLAFPGADPAEIAALERNWWKRLVREVFKPWGPFDRFEEFFSELFAFFGRSEAWTLYPEAPEVLAALKERGLILGVISNFDSRLFAILEGLGAARHFDEIVLSSRVGHAKPAPEIFRAALARHRLVPSQAMHVGDSLAHDAAGAAGAGLLAVLIERRDGTASEPFSQVRNLNEILPLLDRLGQARC